MVAQRSALFHRTICPSRWELLVVFTISIAEQKKTKFSARSRIFAAHATTERRATDVSINEKSHIDNWEYPSSTSQEIAYMKLN
jgi:hypothetical protein